MWELKLEEADERRKMSVREKLKIMNHIRARYIKYWTTQLEVNLNDLPQNHGYAIWNFWWSEILELMIEEAPSEFYNW